MLDTFQYNGNSKQKSHWQLMCTCQLCVRSWCYIQYKYI